ncbi:S9 family peptidase [Bifidobacterium aemilianum]|uniref:S9 family peptidase n=1 Tax=Bifidobacterium aemilianum TaxID=2493120 RepID=A0A366K8M8_9BIFI|nr:S9 family peptidase [Bifidobacterium aemilianum]RBP97483.1 S9 family peptidase [Bifidobacterium aemilianum]
MNKQAASVNLELQGQESAKQSQTSASVDPVGEPLPPKARREPQERQVHGDIFADPYEWMRQKDSPEVQQFVAAQNEYCRRRTSHLDDIKHKLFQELKERTQETDMSVPTRMDGYWYFVRVVEGQQYAVQCRLPITGPDDWDPPQVDAQAAPGSLPGEEVIFDTNAEAEGHDFYQLGGMDLSRDGRWMLYGSDSQGRERYDFRLRDLTTGQDLPDRLDGIAGACLTPDAQWVFYTVLDDAWRPCAVRRHRVGSPTSQDREVFREEDERFWVGLGLSFDERYLVISTGSKTTSEMRMLPVDQPEGDFQVFIPRQQGIEYDASFASFEGAGPGGQDIPLAIVYHNAGNPNFEIDLIDLRDHRPPYRLGEGVCLAQGSPYGCEQGDRVEAGASGKPVNTPYWNPRNPAIMQGARGLAIEGVAMYRHFVTLSYRADSLPHLALMTKDQAARDFAAGRPWAFKELVPVEGDGDADGNAGHQGELAAANSADGADRVDRVDGAGSADSVTDHAQPCPTSAGEHLYSFGGGGNPSYDAPRMRYSFASYTRPGQLRELDPVTGRDRLLKAGKVLGDFDAANYAEHRAWVRARDGELIPVSLVWRRDRLPQVGRAFAMDASAQDSPAQTSQEARTPLRAGLPVLEAGSIPMFILGYGAYEISSDPGFSVARLSLLDRGVLYVVAHVRGGGEMGRAWYEQGRRLQKKHSFEDFVDLTKALQEHGFADPSRTVANGGSAGGLLMGAVANMAPELYAGIEADVPFVDALTSILDPSLPLTVTEWDEWGDPLHDRRVYDYMKSYSPYENTPRAPGDSRVGHYPKILVTTSMNDTRVLYVEPLKWVARLQSAGVDAMARIEVEAGHAGGSGRYKQWEDISFENAWCLDRMGARS